MGSLYDLPLDAGDAGCVNAVIEIPLGDVNKYEYDPTLDVFRLARNLFSPVHYPGNYGFIPSTLGANGKPVAALVLASAPSFTGCLIEVRPLGLLEVHDEGVPEAKVVAVGKNSPRFRNVDDLSQVPEHLLREIETFFSSYKKLEGKRSESIAWHGVEATWAAIHHAHERWSASGDSPARARLDRT
jgi:inorganic pyrophosphatase